MSLPLQRALVLLEQGRHDVAEKELRLALADDPDNGQAYAMLAVCLVERDAFDEACQTAQQGVHLIPDEPYAHYVLAFTLFHRDHHVESQVALLGRKNSYEEALSAIREAIRLEPEDADYFGLLANIHLAKRDWPSALQAAENGLKIDPEHVGCLNSRAMALVNLGRRDEAGQTIDGALRQAPDNAVTHANRGWALLHEGKPQPALEHFREALRLDPELDWARKGIVEALKARNFVYRWMLAYFLLMSRLSAGQQWGIILGSYFLLRFLGSFSHGNSPLAWGVGLVRMVLLFFVLFSWSATHFFNLLLRLDKFGCYALSRNQILGANAVGLCLLFAIVLAGLGLIVPNYTAITAGLGCLALTIPVGGTFSREGRARLFLGIYTGALILVGAACFLLALQGSPMAATLGNMFVLGIFLFGFVANIMATH